MLPPADPPIREPRFKVALAWAAAAWEEVWRAAWPIVAVVGAFLALAWLDVLPDLPGWLHALVLAAAAVALAAAVWRARRAAPLPDRHAARRRLERDSGLAHRPLTTALDTQISGTADPASRALWDLHRRRLHATLRALRVRLPRPGAAESDRFGLRGLVILGLVVAAIGAWGDWPGRLKRALVPSFETAEAAAPPTLDLFLTPPPYTGIAPVYLSSVQPAATEGEAAEPAPIRVPTGSTLLARVTGGAAAPMLAVNGVDAAFPAVDALTWEITQPVTAGRRIVVSQAGETLGDWPIEVLPDAPPTIAFAEPPEPTERYALRLAYAATDDYGVATVTATIALGEGAPEALHRTPIVLELSVPGRWPREATSASFHDLTPHSWAGQPVTIALNATDAAGQSAQTDPIATTLPERVFNHPIARAIIDQRRTLTLDPTAAQEVAESLETLSQRPDRYYDDHTVFLALRTAARRLFFSEDKRAQVAPLRDLLWATALRLEDGDLSLAENALRNAQQRLAEALDRNASDEDIRQLMDELRQALDRYMEAMRQQMMERLARGELPQEMQIPPDAQMVDRDQLQEMLDRMQELSESGARDQARDMLAQLQEMLENMQSGMMAQQQAQAQQQAMQLLEDLQQLSQAQRELMDQTYRQSQQGQQGQQGEQGEPQPGQQGQNGQGGEPQPGGQGDAATQEALRRMLGELMREMGEMTGDIPMPFGRAEQAMRDAEQALGQGMPGEAVPSQGEALDQLQQGIQGLADQMMEQMAQQPGARDGRTGQRMFGGQDPLGRPMPNTGGANTQDVGIPQEADMQRARAILDELRRRLGERSRPELERDYIERLLDRF